MDPKNLPSLDPKLKEAYDRVMGTSLGAPAQTAPAPTPPSPTPAPTPLAPAPFTPQAVPAMQSVTQSVPVPTPTPAKPTESSTFVATGGNHGVGNKPKISPVLLVVAGIIFFAVYALFWLRYFNVPLPFLP